MNSPRNRLARESSPYLLLHAENPVDWFPWGEEAFEKARREDKPLFLSVGYSSCYWCHVMERESFSDPEIARQLNDGFVSIKLDREERPDLDEIYMAATQLLTQSGGWPNSLFLTHDLKPFFAGTYFPPRDRMGRPGFPRVLTALREAWALRREGVLEQAEALAEAMREHLGGSGSGSLPDAGIVGRAQAALARRFDPEWGGFGPAPKFPSPANLFFLLDRARGGDEQAREMLVVTLDRMARGGIHDQIGGGFHRYSTDGRWLVPHFEKMLYDNAALAVLYAEAAPLAPAEGFARTARRTLDFVLAELTEDEGGFRSAIDAETDGEEGAYYTWREEELGSALSEAERAVLAPVYGFDGSPNFEGRRYVLHLPRSLEEQARSAGIPVEALLERVEPGRKTLLAARSRRKRPLVDDKVLVDWNGLMIGSMARASGPLGEPRYLEAAIRAAEFLLDRLVDASSGLLLHSFRAGVAKVPALLDDYAFLVDGLLAIQAATGDGRWLADASRLAAEQEQRLWDQEGGGYFTAPEDPHLLVRPKAAHDGPAVSGNGVAALNHLELARLTGEARHAERAEQLLRCFGSTVEQWPLGHLTLVRALMRGGLAASPDAPAAPVAKVTLEEEALGAVDVQAALRDAPGAWKPFHIDLTIKGGWHLNANPALLRFLVPTEIRPGRGGLRGVRYPVGDRYEGRVRIEGEVEPPGEGEASISLTYQACDEARCLPALTIEVPLR